MREGTSAHPASTSRSTWFESLPHVLLVLTCIRNGNYEDGNEISTKLYFCSEGHCQSNSQLSSSQWCNLQKWDKKELCRHIYKSRIKEYIISHRPNRNVKKKDKLQSNKNDNGKEEQLWPLETSSNMFKVPALSPTMVTKEPSGERISRPLRHCSYPPTQS